MKTKYCSEEERQLFTLFKQLGLQIERERDLGMMISYSVVSSLLDFETSSNSHEEVIFEQVKRVHSGLEEVICYSKQRDYYAKLCELKSRVDPLFKQEENFSGPLQGRMAHNIFSRLYQNFSKSYEDRLKRDGIAIYNEVMRYGPLKGRRNILNHDYKMVDWFFAKGGK